jgi:hypothetical protein
MAEFHRIIVAFGALITATVSSPASAQTKAQVPTSSIKAHAQLWTYEVAAKYGETPDERLSCGQAALELGRSILEDWGPFWCGAPDKASGNRECAIGRKPSDATHVSYERGARLWVDKHGQHYLVMAYRRDISDVSFAELRRQRAFLDRAGKVGCETRGPWKVWHPKKRSPFALKIERRLVRGDRTLLPREPRLRRKIEAEWEFMTGEGNGDACESCGRNARLCAECALVSAMGCNQYRSVIVAPDTDGRVRIIDLHDVEPGEVPFGRGASEASIGGSKR